MINGVKDINFNFHEGELSFLFFFNGKFLNNFHYVIYERDNVFFHKRK